MALYPVPEDRQRQTDQAEPNPPEGQSKVVSIKQLESKAEIVIGLFCSAAAGALYDALQNGMPHDWPTAKRMLLSAGFAGLVAVFGWIKMRSPFQPPQDWKPSQS